MSLCPSSWRDDICGCETPICRADIEAIRAEALREAAKWMNDGGWLHVVPGANGDSVEIPAGDAMLKALGGPKP